MLNDARSAKASLVLCGLMLGCLSTATVVRFPLGFSAVSSFEVSSVSSTSFGLCSLKVQVFSLSSHSIRNRYTTSSREVRSNLFLPLTTILSQEIEPRWAYLSAMASRWAFNQLSSDHSQNINMRWTLQRNFTHDLVYFTEISIGTPPQRIQVLIDISAPETFISSVNCEDCATEGTKYNSSRSCSSKVQETTLEVDYRYLFASGNMTIDTFGFSELHIKNQPFLQATVVRPIGLSWDDISIINGIVGLTPSSAGSIHNNPSPFMSMVEEKILDQNVFSMRLREPRELMFGGVNQELFIGEIVKIPLTNKTGRYALSGRWQAEARYLTLGSEPGIRMSLAGYTASFSTGSAFILLPNRLALDILQDLQFEDIPFLPPSVACERRNSMPDLIFNLAGQNFTLTPYDYTYEFPLDRNTVRCVGAILPFGVEKHDEIVFGSAFLRAFYSVFDLDTKSLGCKFANFYATCSLMFHHYWLMLASRFFVCFGLNPDIARGIQVRIRSVRENRLHRSMTHHQWFRRPAGCWKIQKQCMYSTYML